MTPRLSIEDVTRLLKTEIGLVEGLAAEGALHGVVKDGIWSTTREILAADLEILTESARIERLRGSESPVFSVREAAPVWLTGDWVAASLLRVRAVSRED